MVRKLEKFIKSLDDKTKTRLKKKLQDLETEPRKTSGVKRLKNWGKDVYRIRVGKIRIIYRIKSETIEIIDIDYRGNIY